MARSEKPQPRTTMSIKEVYLIEAGDNKGDLVINIVARRGRKTYKFPYQIKKIHIPTIDPEYLKAKVRSDIDALEATESKENAVISRLSNMVGAKVGLD